MKANIRYILIRIVYHLKPLKENKNSFSIVSPSIVVIADYTPTPTHTHTHTHTDELSSGYKKCTKYNNFDTQKRKTVQTLSLAIKFCCVISIFELKNGTKRSKMATIEQCVWSIFSFFDFMFGKVEVFFSLFVFWTLKFQYTISQYCMGGSLSGWKIYLYVPTT